MRPRRGWRWIRNTALFLGVFLLFGATYESMARSQDARAYPPLGRMVSIGDRRLHLYCMGTGSPTVILEAGSGPVSPFWLPVQAEAAKLTRVCAYDRAGYGWSDPSTTAAGMVFVDARHEDVTGRLKELGVKRCVPTTFRPCAALATTEEGVRSAGDLVTSRWW